jgi:hypothetical protein
MLQDHRALVERENFAFGIAFGLDLNTLNDRSLPCQVDDHLNKLHRRACSLWGATPVQVRVKTGPWIRAGLLH